MKNEKRLIKFALLIFLFSGLLAHGGTDENRDREEREVREELNSSRVQNPENPSHLENGSTDLSEFPSLHPLIVHFPIVLLLLAPCVYFAGLRKKKTEFLALGTLLALAGLGTGATATFLLHPHVNELSPEAHEVFVNHEYFAYLTLTFSLAGVLFSGILSRFQHPSRKNTVALVFLLLAALSVSISGHFGASLTHLHGVGPRGEFLKSHH